MPKLSKSKLLSLISQEVQNSLGFYSSDLATQRKEAIKYYLGEPLGNEIEGRSSVVSQDLLEVVESILPSLMRMFTQQGLKQHCYKKMVSVKFIGKHLMNKKKNPIKI